LIVLTFDVSMFYVNFSIYKTFEPG